MKDKGIKKQKQANDTLGILSPGWHGSPSRPGSAHEDNRTSAIHKKLWLGYPALQNDAEWSSSRIKSQLSVPTYRQSEMHQVAVTTDYAYKASMLLSGVIIA
ncbi:uncharacterized protein ARMOST_14224 [Armillaria ostoyae]|uniref:Uncharacterized protein n=1 Tax=Armillaria ostoyae TaxID=47428 RepID=A0A284RPZ8_ARMOS|nr:uncharacterized protein ARMOST_14224 [Armillaria ostoyae]